MDEEDGEKELTDLQREIDIQLEKDKTKKKFKNQEKNSRPSSSDIASKILNLGD